jgi:hypothetical protein
MARVDCRMTRIKEPSGLLYRIFGRAQRPGASDTPFPFEQLLRDTIDRHLDPYPYLADLFAEKAAAQGLRLSKRERGRIEEELRNQGGSATIPDPWWKWWDKRSLSIELTEEDTQGLVERVKDAFADKPEQFVKQAVESAPRILATLRKTYPAWLRRRNRRVRRLEARIARMWQKPFESLEILIELAEHIGRSVGQHYTQHSPPDPRLVFVLTRLHGRGIHIANEILTLLRTGYPEAAMARWRTLHEVVVVSSFIVEHGGESARLYLEHAAVASFKAAKRYQRFAKGRGFAAGFQPLTEEEFANLRTAHEAAVAAHGEPFRRDYGWAASFLNNAKPTFADLEDAVSLDHYRPFYGAASDSIHAGPKGLQAKLGSVSEDLLLLGPSPYGLADPGQNTALSLALLIGNRMRLCTVVDTIVVAQVAGMLAQKTAAQFVATGAALESELNPREESETIGGGRES